MNDRPFSTFSRIFSASVALALLAALVGGQTTTTPLTLVAREGRRTIAVSLVANRQFVALDDLAAIFQLAAREESGALTVSYKGRTIVLTPEQALASVAGRLISLPAPPARVGARWMVPIEFISRALAPIYDTRLDLRANTHLLIVGDLRVPRVAIRYEPLATSARLTVDATPRTASTVAQDNKGLTIKFDADALDVVVPAIQVQGLAQLVQAIRVLDGLTLAVDLGPRFGGFRASTETLDNTTRLVVDIVSTQTTETAAPPPAPPPPPPTELPLFGQPASAIRTMAIDPGHGGADQGVTGAEGTVEKDLTLAVARRLKASLETRLGIRVLLTRDDDRNVTLDDRTAVANNSKADLFISLHANGSLRATTRGASIYVAAFSDSDRAGAALAPARLPIFGGGSREIELVLWDLAQIRHVDQSTALAGILESQFQGRVPLEARPIERAPVRVLESANMPAVLIEMGYLTNANQERQLASGEFQNTLVQAVLEAVQRFRDHLAGDSGGGR